MYVHLSRGVIRRVIRRAGWGGQQFNEEKVLNLVDLARKYKAAAEGGHALRITAYPPAR